MKKVFLKMTNSQPFYFRTHIMLIAFLALLTSGCSNDDNQPTITPEEPAVAITEIADDIKELIYFQGDEKAATVLIAVPGGPSTVFATDVVDEFFPVLNPKNILTVTVHQAQTLDSTIVKSADITLEQAVNYNAETIDMLDKVTSYFKNQGRAVYVLGFSFGAFVTQELIAKKGIDSADKYLIMTGRLDMNAVIWQGAAEGRNGFFENGVTPNVDPDPDPEVKERNLNRISAGFSMNRYTQLFSTISDLSSITYIYGATDQAVGSLTDNEVQFLASKNTTIIAGSGDHTATLENLIVQGFKDAFGIDLK